MRPIFFGATLQPPAMDVLLPSLDGEYRIVTGVRIRATVTTLEEATIAAVREVSALTPLQVELLREVSVPFDRSQLPPDPAAAFVCTAVEQLPLYPGSVFCPACCRKLGTGDSPAIGYLTACPGCRRGISIEFTEFTVRVTLRID